MRWMSLDCYGVALPAIIWRGVITAVSQNKAKMAYVHELAECQVSLGFEKISKSATYLGVAFEDRSFIWAG
jgi:hypothetical protein